jgi:hypothetical protein
MPQYRFNQEDAAAIMVYLRSLAPAGSRASPEIASSRLYRRTERAPKPAFSVH